MKTPRLWMALAASTLLLAACDRDVAELPKAPQRDAAGEPTTATNTPSRDGSVPAASVVLAGQPGGPQNAASGARTSAALTGAQESTAMPMAGQNNDHGAPLPPARAASTR